MNEVVPDKLQRLLVDGSRELDIFLGPRQLQDFMLYLAALQKWNRAYNLTAIKSGEEIICRHFLDSFTFLTFLSGISGSVLDLGSGAGFPGLPLALLLPAVHFLLVEARRKKTLFLQHVVRMLKLENVDIHHLHLQKGNGSTELDLPVAALVSRAVSAGDEVFPLAAEIVAPGGRVLLSATDSSREKILAALSLHEGLVLKDIKAVTIPFLGQQRFMIQIVKT